MPMPNDVRRARLTMNNALAVILNAQCRRLRRDFCLAAEIFISAFRLIFPAFRRDRRYAARFALFA